MSDVSGVNSIGNGNYFLRTRGDVLNSQAAGLVRGQGQQQGGRVLAAQGPDSVSFSQALTGATQAAGLTTINGVTQPATQEAVVPDEPQAFGQSDLDALLEAFGATDQTDGEGWDGTYDLNGDGSINSTDLNIMLSNFVA